MAPVSLAIYELADPFTQPFGIAFDAEADAVSFERDFSVRKRVVALSVKIVRGMSSLQALEDRILDMKRHGLAATLKWMVCGLLKLMILATLLDCVLLYVSDQSRPLDRIFSSAIQDVISISTLVVRKMFDISGTTCGLLVRGISA